MSFCTVATYSRVIVADLHTYRRPKHRTLLTRYRTVAKAVAAHARVGCLNQSTINPSCAVTIQLHVFVTALRAWWCWRAYCAGLRIRTRVAGHAAQWRPAVSEALAGRAMEAERCPAAIDQLTRQTWTSTVRPNH
jgi:hypothetical protein